MKFQGRCVGIAAFTPRTLGDIGVNIQRFVEVVIDELFNKRRHEVVGHLGIGIAKIPGESTYSSWRGTHPGHLVHAGEFVLVVRLVLVKIMARFSASSTLFVSSFDDGKVLRRGGVGDVLCMPSVRERFCTVVARWFWVGKEAHTFRILPLSIDHDIERGGEPSAVQGNAISVACCRPIQHTIQPRLSGRSTNYRRTKCADSRYRLQ